VDGRFSHKLTIAALSVGDFPAQNEKPEHFKYDKKPGIA